MPVLGLLNAVAVLACAAVAFRLIRSFFPAFDREVFYYGTYVRARIAYFLDNAVFRHVERVFSGGAGAPRAGDKAVSPKWLTRVLRASGDIDGNTVVTAVTMDKAGLDRGFVGAMTRFNVTYSTDAANAATKTGVPPASLVVKMNANNFQGTFGSILLRTPREAWFYNHMAAAKQAGSASHSGVKLSAFNTPRVYYSYSNFFTGRYTVVMEDMANAAHPLAILGNQCWGKPAAQPAGAPTPRAVLDEVFTQAADMHAAHWCDRSLFSCSQLKNVDLWTGRGRARHEAGRTSVASHWARVQVAVAEGGPLHGKLNLSPKLVAIMNASVKATSWETFQAEYNPDALPFTLCHGDFHAGNMLWRTKPFAGLPVGLVAVDWAEVGVHHGATGLSQFLISNTTIEMRRQHERRLVELYWNRLVKQGVDGKKYTLEMCWDRYVRGGIERWLQMCALLWDACVDGKLPPFGAQWFHDQLDAFIQDHAQDGVVYPLASIYCLPRSNVL